MPASKEQLQQSMKTLMGFFHDRFTPQATELITQQIPITELHPTLVATACGKALLHCGVAALAAGHQLPDAERQLIMNHVDEFVQTIFAPYNQHDPEVVTCHESERVSRGETDVRDHRRPTQDRPDPGHPDPH